MRLYRRDYFTLTEAEELAWQAVKRREDASAVGPPDLPIKQSLYMEYPKAARHFLEFFPNNYLDFMELREVAALEPTVAAFEALLDAPGVDERVILRHLKDTESYPIVGSILKTTNFGHHAAYLFPEFPLGTTHRADYLLVGRNSHGHHFVFVEFEAPSGQTVLRSGGLGLAARNGLEQVDDWRAWLERNFPALQEVFEKYKKPGETLPEEFSRLDTTRLHYVVVAGRRAHFKSQTYRISRGLDGNRRLLHYDNLVDSARGLIGALTY